MLCVNEASISTDTHTGCKWTSPAPNSTPMATAKNAVFPFPSPHTQVNTWAHTLSPTPRLIPGLISFFHFLGFQMYPPSGIKMTDLCHIVGLDQKAPLSNTLILCFFPSSATSWKSSGEKNIVSFSWEIGRDMLKKSATAVLHTWINF